MLGSGVLLATFVALSSSQDFGGSSGQRLRGAASLIAVAVTFAGLIFSEDFSPVEKKRIYVILVLFIASALFWSIFEQAGSTLNLVRGPQHKQLCCGYELPFQLVSIAQLDLHLPFAGTRPGLAVGENG